MGLGYVGLPTATFSAEKGFPVIGCDIKENVVKFVSAGKSPLKDLNIDGRVNGAVKNGKLTATLHVTEAVRKSEWLTIPTATRLGPVITYSPRVSAVPKLFHFPNSVQYRRHLPFQKRANSEHIQ